MRQQESAQTNIDFTLKLQPEQGDEKQIYPNFWAHTTVHRRLFEALEDGWFRPKPEDSGLLFGLRQQVKENIVDCGQHAIEVHIKLDKNKLPLLKPLVLRNNHWEQFDFNNEYHGNEFIWWPGPYPVFAISSLAVNSEEELVRLKKLSKIFSNIKLPDVPITIDPKPCVSTTPDPPQDSSSELVLDSDLDSIHGALTMAVWAVPRIEPWLRFLECSLSSRASTLSELAKDLDASWLRFPPWLSFPTKFALAPDIHEALWFASVEVLSERCNNQNLPEKIYVKASALSPKYKRNFSEFLNLTCEILRGNARVRIVEWKDCPVGFAILLLLTRRVPEKFRTWAETMPDLPPAVFWSAAILCGLHNGFRKLSNQFRSRNTNLWPFIAACALRSWSSKNRYQVFKWPSYDHELKWHVDEGRYILSADNSQITIKAVQARGKWYMSDFENPDVRTAAKKTAEQLSWPCLRTELIFEADNFDFDSSVTRNEHFYKISLPLGCEFKTKRVLDVESFRKHIAIAAGTVTDPPQPKKSISKFSAAQSKITKVPGLYLIEDFISKKEEDLLVKEIDKNWHENKFNLNRRVQHYGWEYDYKARRVHSEMRIGELPRWAKNIATRLVNQKIVANMPDQLIVNEYVKNQGIGPHKDSKDFDDGIVMLSLLESWQMRFKQKETKKTVNIMLERRSVAVMTGEARYQWTHEIPRRLKEPDPKKPNDKKLVKVRGRRLSFTFRKVLT